MHWLFLLLSGCLEIFGVYIMGLFARSKSIKFIFILAISFGISLIFLRIAMKEISMGTAYAIFTGIGAVGGTFVGMWKFGESRDIKRLFFIFIILICAVCLKFLS